MCPMDYSPVCGEDGTVPHSFACNEWSTGTEAYARGCYQIPCCSPAYRVPIINATLLQGSAVAADIHAFLFSRKRLGLLTTLTPR
jgi:hypothetical protein